MKIVQNIYKPEILLLQLEELCKQRKGYILRGQPDSKFQLIPGAFRDEAIEKFRNEYRARSWKEWSNSKDVNELVCQSLSAAHRYFA